MRETGRNRLTASGRIVRFLLGCGRSDRTFDPVPEKEDNAVEVQAFLDRLQTDRHYEQQLAHVQIVPAREPRYATPAVALHDAIRNALANDRIDQLYLHQAAAVSAACGDQPRDVVVVTGTASGKTLCYNIPVLNTILNDPTARALYLFPTKALTQDQLGTLDRLCDGDPRLKAAIKASTFDGDTSTAKRRAARRSANVILSNPDMLHANILPQNGRWAAEGFFDNLKYVVIDEIHAYRGTFGSHVANVIRRLRRICNHYGSDPTFICCSATIANPGDLASRLIGRDVQVIDDDGSPRGRKFFVLWNPPFLDRSQLERRSANIEAQQIMKQLILDGAQTITFARARVVAELIYKYLKEDLVKRHPELAERVRPYRGGYLADDRREIERLLFSGKLLGVCSTNALELGIDVGTLDAAIITGFPGTICSVLQQAGRAGRSQDESLAVFIAYNDPIDQYFIRHPDYFFGQSPEHAAIAPHNDRVLQAQLMCASSELPMGKDDDELFGCDVIKACDHYRIVADEHDIWQQRPDGRMDYHRKDGALPHHRVNLRLIGSETFDIVDITDGRNISIGNIDSISAPELVYPNAIYLHEGNNFLVRELDFDGKIAHIERTNVDYYTQAVLSDQCRVIETQRERDVQSGQGYFGKLDVTWQTVAFKKIKYYTMEVIGQDALDLPPQTIHTTGVWATLPGFIYPRLKEAEFKAIEAVIGIRNLLLSTLPMLAMCDRRDISGCVDSSNLGQLAMFVYDRYDGGLGYAELGYEHFEELLGVCHEIVTDCPCKTGCPSCVGLANVRPPLHADPDLGAGYAIPNKEATKLALKIWTGA